VVCTRANVVRSPEVELKPRMAPMSKKSMISLIEAWEDQKDQYASMKDFVESFYQDNKKTSSSKSKKKQEEESEGSNVVEEGEVVEQTPRVKVNLLVPSSKSKKKGKSRREKIITEIGEKEVKVKKPSKYLDFLKNWRVENPEIKGKDAIKNGAAAWQEYKKTLVDA